ncbi:phosphate acetyltransferase [Sansalvadorimonas sp. 2012CJ34-2]|uniref:Phosphate acetyltransferase n=1 Tax=Parendozoicomonas callyspongiae TaxID=2942213 RepID=A0ABT0PAW9_9GAMM|nr:phosphate acetyltransferase [Sansalvadorimonas sp. 2012CJ34-2]MCL6268418.1 phosphate acetyltransferase [Sansalvadorimonas sp. 2012CJ34-2]
MHTFYVAPTHYGVGLTSVSLGLVRALDKLGCRVRFFKPIAQTDIAGPEHSVEMVRATMAQQPVDPIALSRAEDLLGADKRDVLMEEIVANFDRVCTGADVVIVEGMVPTRTAPYVTRLNSEISKTLNAKVVMVGQRTGEETLSDVTDHLNIAADIYGGLNGKNIFGYVLNKIDPDSMEKLGGERSFDPLPGLKKAKALPLGYVPWRSELAAVRTKDVAEELGCDVMFAGEMATRRMTSCVLCARTAANMSHLLKPGALVVVSGDRDDVILATCMAAQNGVPLAGLLLTGENKPAEGILSLAHKALSESGLPVLTIDEGSYETATRLNRMSSAVRSDDLERVEQVMESIAEHMNVDALQSRIATTSEKRLSPPAFRYQLVRKAQAANKRIVLPEGDEPRTIKAAAICQERGIANCVLLGKPDIIRGVAEAQGIELPEGLEILDMDEARSKYVAPMVELRKNKGLTAPMAESQLEDTVVLGTMMLAEQDVDGLVSGAVHTTANTIRPAFQLIKTKPEASNVSSIFFMLMPEQVLVYGDCAVNPDPTAEQLADIAIQSADSAAAFGIDPRVAMISYSTGSSGMGADVEKVREATRIAKECRPDLEIDGPLQYDAASVESVASSKAPDSTVAGRATVFVFPDLNTGNTTYKAVQRSANVVSVGPMLQGLNKPVNDLSRGALVDDIVYTIALTAIQAKAEESN